MNRKPIMYKSQENVDMGIPETSPPVSKLRQFIRIFLGRGVVIFGISVLMAFIIVAIFAPFFAPYDPYEPTLGQGLLGPSKEHLLGTDALGRDTLSRIVYGSRTSLMIGLIVVFAAAIIGVSLGLVAGYYGGWVHTIIMRFIDALMAFPMILLALVIAALLGGGIKNVIIALTVGLVPIYARLMCGQVITGKENDFVMAERALGASNLRIMVRHLIPNCFPPLIVLITMMLGATILAEAGLSFLGIGVEAPLAAWGSMVSDGRDYLLRAPILSFAPGVTIMLVVFSFNMVGDGLRDALDPRLRGVL
jgi:peptide/nickel transport system permease protein